MIKYNFSVASTYWCVYFIRSERKIGRPLMIKVKKCNKRSSAKQNHTCSEDKHSLLLFLTIVLGCLTSAVKKVHSIFTDAHYGYIFAPNLMFNLSLIVLRLFEVRMCNHRMN